MVVPVLDLMAGQVVRGVAGRRAEYRPIESSLAADAQPLSVAAAFAERGFRGVYVADLDAIGGAEPAWPLYRQVMSCGLDLWVDAGLTNLTRARQMAEFTAAGNGLSKIVAGLESLSSPALLEEFCDLVGRDRLIFSLDLKDGRPLTRVPAWQHLPPYEIANLAVQCGVQSMIVLDLARVGVGEGIGTEALCAQLREFHPALQIIAGGGVRSMTDLRALQQAGCDAALVASALHDGRLTCEECLSLGDGSSA